MTVQETETLRIHHDTPSPKLSLFFTTAAPLIDVYKVAVVGPCIVSSLRLLSAVQLREGVWAAGVLNPLVLSSADEAGEPEAESPVRVH